MIQTTEREHKLKTEYQLINLIPATGHMAVFRCGSSWFATPVVCWALAEITETAMERTSPRERFRSDGTGPDHYREALAMVVGEEPGSLEPAAASGNLLGIIADDEDPAKVFARELASDEEARVERLSVKYS
ncbi:MAG: hypothetical protein ACYC4U_02380 [Pirellulaceae bacterium]